MKKEKLKVTNELHAHNAYLIAVIKQMIENMYNPEDPTETMSMLCYFLAVGDHENCKSESNPENMDMYNRLTQHLFNQAKNK